VSYRHDYAYAGYTGKLAAKYVVQNCPTDLKWAVGGRSLTKLTAVVDDITPLNPNRKAPGVVIADSNDLEALTSLAKSTKVVVSLAGPFVKSIPFRPLMMTDMEANLYKPVQKMVPIMLISPENRLGMSRIYVLIRGSAKSSKSIIKNPYPLHQLSSQAVDWYLSISFLIPGLYSQ
jgi:hypothetical protein